MVKDFGISRYRLANYCDDIKLLNLALLRSTIFESSIFKTLSFYESIIIKRHTLSHSLHQIEIGLKTSYLNHLWDEL